MPTIFHSSQARLRHGLLTNATPTRHQQQHQQQQDRQWQQLQQNASNECLAIIIQFNFQQTSVAAPFLITPPTPFLPHHQLVSMYGTLSLSLSLSCVVVSLYAVFIVEYGCVCVRVSCSARKCSHLLNDRLPAPWSRFLLPGECSHWAHWAG